jgi:type VI secretion system protein ImpA
MDLDALLQSHGEEAPSGEDLEYDPVFTELEIAAQPGEERQAGDEILAAEDPDYKEVAEKALDIMQRSHDLRAGIFMAEAQLRLKGLPGFADCTTYVRRCLEEYWDTCHPQLDADDDNDPTMRVNAVFALSDSNRILRGLRKAPLTKSRTFGSMTLRHMLVADGEITPPSDMDGVPDASSITAAFQDTDPAELKALAEAAARALSDVKAIGAKFDTETPGQGPDLDPVQKMLVQINKRMADQMGADAVGAEAAEEEEDAGDGAEGGDATPAPRASGGGGGGSINHPNDVRNAIDRIVAYYERAEPSSPVPILLKRAKKLVGADFMTIINDMAPAGVENVTYIGGIVEAEE